MNGHEIDYAIEAYKNNHVFPLGKYVELFEKKILDIISDEKKLFCTALNSGTSAIHLALKIIGIKKGDEVICSTFTFSASANPIIYEGGTPVFVDSERNTWNMCPDLLKNCILDRIKKGKKPKAIILVHLYGMPSKLSKIIKIADEYNIPIIEDAAEALGSMYNNKYCGTFGKFSIFSFNGNKIITCSGGGALISRSKKHADSAIKYSTQSREKFLHYEHKQIGYNYRLSNILAAIGFGQLEVLNDRVKERRNIFFNYKNELRDFKNVCFQNEPNSNYFSNHWLSAFYISNVKNILELINFLNSSNIESRPLWKPMHLQPFFMKYPKYINNVSEELYLKGICLPSSSLLNNEQQNFVVKKIVKWLRKNF